MQFNFHTTSLVLKAAEADYLPVSVNDSLYEIATQPVRVSNHYEKQETTNRIGIHNISASEMVG